jgi:hypothetical protein
MSYDASIVTLIYISLKVVFKMKLFPPTYTILSFLTAYSKAQDFNAQGTNLKFELCSISQVDTIRVAWDAAIDMAKTVKDSLDFNAPAAIDYLGPPNALGDYKTNIKDMITRASAFGQATFGRVFGWNVYIRCNDPDGKCAAKKTAFAHTVNKLKNDPNGRESKTLKEKRESSPVITFCDRFHTNVLSWKERVRRMKGPKDEGLLFRSQR